MHVYSRLFLTVAMTVAALTCGCTTSSVDGGDLYAGEWLAKDVKGKAYSIILNADGSAVARWPGHPDETGRWMVNEEHDAEIRWDNGWRDIIHLATPKITSRVAFRPGASLKDSPAMVDTVDRASPQP